MKHRFIVTALLLVVVVVALIAKDPNNGISKIQKTSGTPIATLANINRISAWYEADATHENNPFTGNSGLSFPRGTTYAIYSAGLIFGAFSNDGAIASNQPRVTGTSYNSAFSPGAIIGSRTGVTEDPTAADVRIWRIRKDYATADLKLDAAEMGSKSLALVTEPDVAAIRDQYRKDWMEWPAAKGAPFYDANNDGIYTPQFEVVGGIEVPKKYPAADEPGLANADQVVWYVANDIRAGDSPWKTKPLGLEQQVTIWGYNNPGVVGNILFKKIKLIYKGTAITPVNGMLTDAYICHWSDPDLGDAGDDFVGCDTSLSLGFVYNGTGIDREYQKFNMLPPALGYDFLQGPVVPSANDTAIVNLKKRPGFRNLPMSSFIYFAAGGFYSDPPFTLNGSWQWYSMLQGFPPTPQPLPYPRRIVDPVTGDSTFFWLNGDPVTKKGWIDGIWEFPGDRRMLQTSGPFSMALGDTQEIVVGVVGGIGENYLQSISVMKQNDRFVQSMYNSLFELIPPTLTVNVTYPSSSATIEVKATALPGQFSSLTAKILGNDLTLFDDGAHNDGASGDGIFANTTSISRSITPISVDLSMTTSSNKYFKISKLADQITIAGPVTVENATVLSDNINGDKIVNNGEFIHFGITLKNGTDFTLSNVNVGFYSPVDFNSERPYGSMVAGASTSLIYNAGDVKTYFAFRLPLNYSQTTYPVAMVIRDDNGNLWKKSYEFPVVQKTFIADSLKFVGSNIVGNNDGQVGFVLYNPLIAGETYDIWYGGSGAIRNWTAVKNLSGAEYAVVNAWLKPTNQVPSINNLPNASGTGTFALNDAKTAVNYSVTVTGLSGPITAAHIHRGSAGFVGNPMTTLTFNGNTSSGTWQIPDSLLTDFIAGNLYVNVHTAANPGGEVRGQIADGMLVRQNVPNPTPGSIFAFPEQRLTGFSLFVGPAPRGVKTIDQTAPTVGNVMFVPNPENTYRIIDSTQNNWAGLKTNEMNVEIRFNNENNWALTAAATPPGSYPVKVPFAIYKDTIRVMPIIRDFNRDTVWNTIGNAQWNNKNVFDRIIGIVDDKDASNNDIRYYSPLNTVFPAINNTMKGRYINGTNHILTNVSIVNEQNNGTAPVNGTKILFKQFISIKIGDIKTLTLQPLGVRIEQLSSVPNDFSLSQNYPNPFNPSTRIEFSLPKQSFVSLKIYDVIGREVSTVVDEVKGAGRFAVEWNGRNQSGRLAASGVYFYQITAGSFVQNKKMILLK
jgi:hypothetical protein